MGPHQISGLVHCPRLELLRCKWFFFVPLFAKGMGHVVPQAVQQCVADSQQGEIAKSEAKCHNHFFQLEVVRGEVVSEDTMQQNHRKAVRLMPNNSQ